jgi:hypothetical protein
VHQLIKLLLLTRCENRGWPSETFSPKYRIRLVTMAAFEEGGSGVCETKFRFILVVIVFVNFFVIIIVITVGTAYCDHYGTKTN